jgi:hypothetical protein
LSCPCLKCTCCGTGFMRVSGVMLGHERLLVWCRGRSTRVPWGWTGQVPDGGERGAAGGRAVPHARRRAEAGPDAEHPGRERDPAAGARAHLCLCFHSCTVHAPPSFVAPKMILCVASPWCLSPVTSFHQVCNSMASRALRRRLQRTCHSAWAPTPDCWQTLACKTQPRELALLCT